MNGRFSWFHVGKYTVDPMGNVRNPKESILSRMELHKFGIESHTTWGSPDWFFDQRKS